MQQYLYGADTHQYNAIALWQPARMVIENIH